MYNSVFYIIIAILVFDFVFERLLEALNTRWRSKPIPEELQGIYDAEKYRKQQDYARVNTRFSILTASFSFLLMVGILIFQGLGYLHYYLQSYTSHPIILGLLFFGILLFLMDMLSLPFTLYNTFVIEAKFGFNKTTPRTFIFDKLKGYLLTIVLGSIMYTLIYKFYAYTGNAFWLYTWGIMIVFTLFMTLFYSNLIVPLFNKQKALEAGELKDAINAFASRVGFKLTQIYQIDGSRRSTRANAYFTGFGPKKRIVLYDTLINELSTEELVAVLAHEMGHNKKKHSLSGLLLSMLQMGIMLYVLSLLISQPELSLALGVNEPVFHIGLIAFGLLYTPLSMLMGFFMNIFSRKNEYQADNFAAENYKPQALIAALKKLATNNLSNLTPHPLYVWVNYSHPTLEQRIANLLKHNR